MTTDLTLYADLLGDIKARIRQAQVKATLSANAEMILENKAGHSPYFAQKCYLPVMLHSAIELISG